MVYKYTFWYRRPENLYDWSGHKTESVFNNYANHIQKEIALNKIAESTEHLFSPILKKLSSDAVYVIKDDEADEEENALKLLPEKAGAWE